jgi:hypothetical protein
MPRYGLIAGNVLVLIALSVIGPVAWAAATPTGGPCPTLAEWRSHTHDGSRPGPVPNVMGMTRDNAVSALAQGGFAAEAAPADAAGDWTVDDQTPTSEELADCASSVTISLVAPGVEVPDVVDDPLDLAEQAIRDAGLVPVVAEGAAAEPRVVAAQDPDALTKVARGSTVTLTLRVPASPTGVTVPDLRGLTRSAARDRLDGTTLGLVVSGGDSGTVSEQDPAPGTVVARGSSITITLSGGVGPTDPVTPTPGDTPTPGNTPVDSPGPVVIDPAETGSSSGVLPALAGIAIVAAAVLAWALRRGRKPRRSPVPDVVCVPRADPNPYVEIRDVPSLAFDVVCHHDPGHQEIRETVR